MRIRVPRAVRLGCGLVLSVLLLLLAAALVTAVVQGRRTPAGVPAYVALGSSYAAGAGLGPLQSGSPLLCARSTGGYPPRIARATGLALVDMSCGGAVTRHLLVGGQFFQGPQVRVVSSRTRLVTITVGGNDVGYVRDLSLLALRRAGGITGWTFRHLWRGPPSLDKRDLSGTERRLVATIAAIHRRAPAAQIVVTTYPRVLPPVGTCSRLGLDVREAAVMRLVAQALADATRRAAADTGATLVDMDVLGATHHACSPHPWTRGQAAWIHAPFHPTREGAAATAAAILAATASP